MTRPGQASVTTTVVGVIVLVAGTWMVLARHREPYPQVTPTLQTPTVSSGRTFAPPDGPALAPPVPRKPVVEEPVLPSTGAPLVHEPRLDAAGDGDDEHRRPRDRGRDRDDRRNARLWRWVR